MITNNSSTVRLWYEKARDEFQEMAARPGAGGPVQTLAYFHGLVLEASRYDRRNRHASYLDVCGDSDDVRIYVGGLVEIDRKARPMYEYMAWSVYEVIEANGLTLVRLSRSLYAGD